MLMGMGLGVPFARNLVGLGGVSLPDLIASLSGALYVPDTSNCWQDAGRANPCTYDTKVYLMDDVTGTFTASQPTSTNQPYLRSGNYSDLPFVSLSSGSGLNLISPSEDYTSTRWTKFGTVSVSGDTISTPATNDGIMADYSAVQIVGATFTFGAILSGTGTISLWLRERGTATSINRVDVTLTAEPTLYVVSGAIPASGNTGVEAYIRRLSPTTATSVVASNPMLVAGTYTAETFPAYVPTGETWTTTRTMIDAAGGIEWDGADAYWRNSAGTTGNYASTPDSAAASITGDLTLIVKAELADWTPAAVQGLVSKRSGSSGEFGLHIDTNGKVALAWYLSSTIHQPLSTVAIGATDGQSCWIKSVRTIGVKVQFYKSTDYDPVAKTGTWEKIGSDVTYATTDATDTVNPILIGAIGTAFAPSTGKIHYAAAWANTTGTGTPAWEFYPARDAVKPASAWLDFDGTNDYLISSIIPGNYDEGFVCAGAVQTEAIGGTNALFGTSYSNAVKGVQSAINGSGAALTIRYDGTTNTSLASANTITTNAGFVIANLYAPASASSQLNSGTKATSAVTRDYTGTTQYALIGSSNNAATGVTPTNYMQGHIHALAWLPVIPTEAQETAIRSYIAGKAGVTL